MGVVLAHRSSFLTKPMRDSAMFDESDGLEFSALPTEDWFANLPDVDYWSDPFSPWGTDGEYALVGDPAADAAFWELQTTDFTCAVVSQQMILQQFGIDVSEAQLVYDATSNGWITEHGTAPEDAARLLEHYGVSTHTSMGGGLEGLVLEISHGHKVIVGVDSGELWGQDSIFEDWLNPSGQDHAIVVTGIDMSDPDNPQVYVNDPGEPHGAGRAYPLYDFLNAWQDSGQMLIATDFAPPELASHPTFGANFHPDTGIYMDVPYWMTLLDRFIQLNPDVLQEFALTPESWTHSTVGPQSVNPYGMESLGDSARNDLFTMI